MKNTTHDRVSNTRRKTAIGFTAGLFAILALCAIAFSPQQGLAKQLSWQKAAPPGITAPTFNQVALNTGTDKASFTAVGYLDSSGFNALAPNNTVAALTAPPGTNTIAAASFGSKEYTAATEEATTKQTAPAYDATTARTHANQAVNLAIGAQDGFITDQPTAETTEVQQV